MSGNGINIGPIGSMPTSTIGGTSLQSVCIKGQITQIIYLQGILNQC